MENPYLLFEFQDEKGSIEPLVFTNPVKILQTRKLEEISPIMAEIEKAAQEGYYAAGFVSYEAAPAFNPAMEVRPASEFPLVWFGIFEEPERADTEMLEAGEYTVSDWRMSDSPEQYKKGIREIKEAIEEGHTYQVNYTERLHANFKGSDFSFYRQLARNQRAGYSAYLNIGTQQILSASPELFFRVDTGKLTAKPMKGTAARGRTVAEDKENIEKLLASEKERAENLMIVDLLRNDMSRLAKPGTVKVNGLFNVETYPTVHQMTSNIEAEISSKSTVFDWFQALFPCGSITGAPKISTMKKIAELEGSPREVYCGAIGFITPEKNAVFNVPIRTVIIDQEKETARYGVGGGVTWDSTSEGEFRELHTKAQVLTARQPEFQLLESLKLENGEYPLLAYHLERLQDSVAYFNFPGNTTEIRKKLKECAEKHPQGLFKVRLLLSRNGKAEVEAQKAAAIHEPVPCTIAESPVDSRNPFLFHKTTHREVYEKAQKAAPAEAFSTLLWNEKGELTEFTIGNLVAEKDGKFYTPPVECGLLAGTFRQYLLDRGEIEEKIIHKDELGNFDAIWFVNSVRGWLKVELQKQKL